MTSTRNLLGVVALGLSAVSAWGWLRGDEALAGVTVRVGLVFGAVWLAWPSLVAVPRRSWLVVTIALIVLVARPRAAIVVIPVLLWTTSRNRPK